MNSCYGELADITTNHKKMSLTADSKGLLLPTRFNGILNSFLLGDTIFNNTPKNIKIKSNRSFKLLKSFFYKSSNLDNITFVDSFENTRWVKRSSGRNTSLRLVKYPFTSNTTNNELFFLRFDLEDTKLKHKIASDTTYLTLKQKRYKRRKSMPLVKGVVNNETGVDSFSGKLILKNNSKLTINGLDGDTQYRMVKKNKSRNDNIGVLFSKRLLRVKRTLVLPAHVNITAITNSYDVCHSWFIPGLGIKLDCVPGRATHHTFYIDNVGFYYAHFFKNIVCWVV
jgi:hypothetical protein